MGHSRIVSGIVALHVCGLVACGGSDPEPQPAPLPLPLPAATFTVGGTVTGLLGSGLILRNGASDLPITGSGSFQFPDALPDGAAYAITVAAQPVSPEQRCVVTSGTGQVGGADVVNVAVECRGIFAFLSSAPADGAVDVPRAVQPSLTFTANLDAATAIPAAITLRSDAGSEDLAVNTAGAVLALRPTHALLPLTTYTVEVSTDVLSDVGEMLAAPVTLSFKTRDGAWGKAEPLTDYDVSAGGLNAYAPRVVLDPAGNATVLWATERGLLAKRELWTRHYLAGTGWQAPVRIDETVLENTGDAALGVDALGAVIAVWVQTQDNLLGEYSVWSKRFEPGSGWGPAQRIEQQAGNSSLPQLAVHADGTAVAVWYQTEGTTNSIMANRFVPGSGWGAAVAIDNASSVVFRPQVAVGDGGHAIAVWEQYLQGAGNDIFANHYAPSGGWGTPVRVSTTNVGTAAGPALAMSAAGDAVVAWQQNNAGTRFTAASNYRVGAGWSVPAAVETGAGSSDLAQVAIDRAGNAIAVWRQAINGILHAHASRHTKSGGWSTPERINTDGSGDGVFYPRLGFDRSGNALAVWFQLQVLNNRYRVHSSRYIPARGWSMAQPIADEGGFIGTFTPRIAIDDAGNALAVWEQLDTNQVARVMVNRFE
jgi:Bacterial Ig-like domain